MIRTLRLGVVNRTGIVALVALAALTAPVAAYAQDGDLGSLMDRLDRLERDIRTLNVQISRGSALSSSGGTADAPAMGGADLGGGSPAAARLNVRITTLEDELRTLTGKVEESNFHFQQINQRLDQLIGDIDYRLSTLEGRGVQPGMQGQSRMMPHGPQPAPPTAPVQAEGPGTTIISGAGVRGASPPRILGTIPQSDLAPPPAGQAHEQPAADTLAMTTPPASGVPAMAARPTPAPTGTSVLPSGTPREQYAHAFGLLRRAEYDQAEAALTEFMQLHPDDPLASNARYWLGETYYVRADYVRAAETFLRGYQESPKGTKAPDTLLKLGMSLGNLDKKAQACATFTKLAKDFPDASPIIQKKLGIQRSKNDCK